MALVAGGHFVALLGGHFVWRPFCERRCSQALRWRTLLPPPFVLHLRGPAGGGVVSDPSRQEGFWGDGPLTRPPLRRDRLPQRRPDQQAPEAAVQVKRRRTASLGAPVCPLNPRPSPRQPAALVDFLDFPAELRQAFLAETPRGG